MVASRRPRYRDANASGPRRNWAAADLQIDDSSDVELRAALRDELMGQTGGKRKRKRAAATIKSGRNPGRLRALLGFTDEDDYIDTVPTSSSADSDEGDGDADEKKSAEPFRPKVDDKPPSRQLNASVASAADRDAGLNAQPRRSVATLFATESTGSAQIKKEAKKGVESDSSDDEYVLSMGPPRQATSYPPPVPEREPHHPADVVGTDHSSLSDTESDEAEYSLARSESYRNMSLASLPLMTLAPTCVRDAPDSSSSDEGEVVLSLHPSRPPPPAALTSAPTTLAAVSQPPAVGQGQRPAFAASAEQAKIGPLELSPGCSVPAAINRFLRDYQREGVRFFYRAYTEGRGALLGDDMGLGKTIQVIAFLSAIMGKTGFETDADRRIEAVRSGRQDPGFQKANRVWPTCLIICPSSVIDNWRNELDTWGWFEHRACIGSDAKNAIESFRRARLDILLTSHETAAQKISDLKDLDLSCVLIDEAHKLKNPKAQMTKAMHLFDCKARLALTGTAIQNTYRELYTLADWTNPGLLGDVKEWRREIEDPLKMGQKKDCTPEEIANARTRAEKLVKNVLPLFFLRRTKLLIKDQLPHKYDKVVFCPLTKTQLAVYKRILDEPEVQFMRQHADPCDCGTVDPETGLAYQRSNCCYRRDAEGEPWSKHMLKYIYLLQKCSNHVALVFPDPEDKASGDPERAERYDRQLSYVQMMFPDSWKDKRCNAANGMREELCGKWRVLAGLLKQWRAAGDKVLLFSTNLRLLQFIEYFITQEGHSHRRLDGSTPQNRRQDLVNSFNRDADVFIFLISTTAGGTGLNLTAANQVVVFDPHWNPSHDLQAMDRAYRFGQTRDVNVYRLIGAGSLEECVYGRQIYKQQQMAIGYEATKERRYFTGIAGDKENIGELFGVRNLFRLQESGLQTKTIIDECNIAEVTFALERFLENGASNDRELADQTLLDLAHGESATQPQPFAEETDAKENADPIKAILDDVGVEYTHLNNKVTGGSKAEARIYKEAKKATRGSTRSSKSASRASPRTRPQKKLSNAVWPPPRPKAGNQRVSPTQPSKQASTMQDKSGSEEEPALPRPSTSRFSSTTTRSAPSLHDIARLEGTTEAQLAARIRDMSKREQTAFFDRAVQRLAAKSVGP